MSYREQLKKRISDLEAKMAESNLDKLQLNSLRAELAKLNMQDFEEDMREQSGQQLLKG
jgi:hypothetical protein